MRVYFKLFIAVITAFVFNIAPSFALPQLLIDMKTGEVLYEQDAGVAWHPASLTKLMTAFVVFEAIKAGRISLDTPVMISAKAQKAPPSKSGLPRDTAISVRDALFMIIIKSANDVSIALAETVSGSEEKFVIEMNQMAQALGLSATHFVNSNGLHKNAQVVSARDIAILALNIRVRHANYDTLFATSEVILGEKKLKTHNNLLTEFVGTNGMKTGFVCAAGLNIVATVKRNGRSLMVVILGASSARERGEMAAQLLLKGFSGNLKGQGKSVKNIRNIIGSKPVNMRPMICAEGAKAYVAQREAQFPYGLEGKQSFLSQQIMAQSYRVKILGKMRNIPYPRIRPYHEAKFVEKTLELRGSLGVAPLPRPRPIRLY